MRCGVDKSCEADAQALGRPTQHHRTLKFAWYGSFVPTPVATSSRVFSNGGLHLKGANVLLECSTQEGYAWMGETDESAEEFGAFLYGVGVLYEYLGVGRTGVCMITLV
jgi:hypothetical protein